MSTFCYPNIANEGKIYSKSELLALTFTVLSTKKSSTEKQKLFVIVLNYFILFENILDISLSLMYRIPLSINDNISM